MAIALAFVAGLLVMMAIDGADQTPVPEPTAPPEQTATEPPAQAEPPVTDPPANFTGKFNGPNLTAYTKNGYSRPQVRQDLARIASLGSTAVALVPTWYMKSPASDRIAPDRAKTPSDASLRQAFEWAGEQGLAVVLKPHIDVLDESFRGDIQPVDRSTWFGSYERFISHYVKLAADSGAALFVIGTELKSMSSDTDQWRSVIDAVRGQFYGQLTYAANWDEVSQVQFWDELDMIGVDAYYPLASEGEAPTEQSLAAAWQPNVDALKSLSNQWGVPVLLTEFGYPTQATAASNPFGVSEGEPADQAAQALLYQAAFDAFSGKGWVNGLMWWSWRADPGAGEDQATDYTPEGKVAEQVIGSAQG
jgi:hypothetical protein